ncbi:MAG: adenylate/guanylate cyclase domain-containing protein, partial [Pseudomonadota bacterium]
TMSIWMRDMELGENVMHYLQPAARLPDADAFVHLAVAVTALKRGDRQAEQSALDWALDIRPDFTWKLVRNAFYFPKWKALVSGISAELETLVSMGLPAE